MATATPHTHTHFDSQWLAQICADLTKEEAQKVQQCVQWVEPLLVDQTIPTMEPALVHAQGVAKLLSLLQLDVSTILAALLSVLPPHLMTEKSDFKKDLISRFGLEVVQLVDGSRALVDVSFMARQLGQGSSMNEAQQQEMLRKMLLAMATDLRIVMMRLCSRLETLRWYAATKTSCPKDIALETRGVYAPLANRLGIWQIKWEMEDLTFRFLHPDIYHDIAKKLEGTRVEREARVKQMVEQIQSALVELNIKAEVAGRAKHIYSIYNKMRNKHLEFEQLMDLQALRIIVESERDCYTALSFVHTRWTPVMKEFDDYIAHPKSNGYRSLHTVVQDDEGHIFEVQIRTQEMHKFAEYGMAAHWRYKEAGAKGGQVSASSLYDRQVSWMRQLIAWRQEVGVAQKTDGMDEVSLKEQKERLDQKSRALQADAQEIKAIAAQTKDDHIYVLTPQARVIELVEGSTPIDFAYRLHTDLGHRCRGARVNGQMVALNTKLKTGQTVEIITAKSGGPSRDWLNPELGYLASPRARSKVRLWFNAIELQNRMTAGQAQVEKELQRLGKTATNLEHLAQKLGFARADDFYVAVAKDEFSVRSIASAFVEPSVKQVNEESNDHFEGKTGAQSVTKTGKSGVLVVGVDSLMTQLAGCCHPAPPDQIGGFVTTGRGVSIHRQDCPAFASLQQKHPERIIDVDWGDTHDTVYPVTVSVRAHDRNGLLRDITETFARLKLNVTGANTQTKQGTANMRFTVEVSNAEQLSKALQSLSEIVGVFLAERV